MSLAFQLEIDSNRAGGRLRRFAAGLGALGVLVFAAGLLNADLWGWAVTILVMGLALIAWFGLRPGAPGPVGLLTVDAVGLVQWADQRGLTVSARASSWRRGSSLIWLQLQDQSGHSLDLLIGRAQCSDEQWSALSRWLLWMERGSTD
jgi:hypothetical protein